MPLSIQSDQPPARRPGPVAFLRPAYAVLPGFRLAMGVTLLALGLIVLLPLTALVLRAAAIGPAAFWELATAPRTLAALRLSFGAALIGATINAVFGTLVAWVLTRYDFPGRRLADAMVDLPFALPTAVAGVALTALYAENGALGRPLAALGVKVAYTPLGVVVALAFIGLPFVVRSVQPVLAEAERDVEEAAALLGAGRLRTFFQIILPTILPALATGFSLALARGVGEYGSVIFIAGNLPMISEIAPLLVIIKLEAFDYAGATVVAATMLVLSFTILIALNAAVAWREGGYARA
jgi:sulfate transport system permease protein